MAVFVSLLFPLPCQSAPADVYQGCVIPDPDDSHPQFLVDSQQPWDLDLLPAVPPFSGAQYALPEVLVPEDDSTFEHLTREGRTYSRTYDRDWFWRWFYKFDAHYGGDRTIEVLVSTDHDSKKAKMEATRYAHALGQLPKVLLAGVRTIQLLKEADRARASIRRGLIIMSTDRQTKYVEEILIHEAAHLSLDPKYKDTLAWRRCQRADGNYISDYAKEFPSREDIAESFVAYLAAEYRPLRVGERDEGLIRGAIPNRIQFFKQRISDRRILPMVSDSELEDGPLDLRFAFFENGEGTITHLVLENDDRELARPWITFYDSDGETMFPDDLFDSRRVRMAGFGSMTPWRGVLPGQQVVLSTHGRGDRVFGTVRIQSEQRIQGHLTIDDPDLGTVTIGMAKLARHVYVPIRGGRYRASEIFLSNVGEVRTEYRCSQRTRAPWPFSSKGELGRNESFLWISGGVESGHIRCQVTSGGKIAVTVLESDLYGKRLTLAPVTVIEP